MAHKSYREESRKDYGTTTPGTLDRDQIRTGALLRIADATELMARRHTQLIMERDEYKRFHEEADRKLSAIKLSNSALRGQITKLRKQLATKTA